MSIQIWQLKQFNISLQNLGNSQAILGTLAKYICCTKAGTDVGYIATTCSTSTAKISWVVSPQQPQMLDREFVHLAESIYSKDQVPEPNGNRRNSL